MRLGLPSLLTFVFVSVPLLSEASFDLALIPSYNTTLAEGSVKRLDPANSVRLGDFANGNSLAMVDYNPRSGNTWTHRTSGTIARYDHNTGIKTWESSGNTNPSGFIASPNETYLYYGSGSTTITRLDTSTFEKSIFNLHSSYSVIKSLVRTDAFNMLLSGVTSTGDFQMSNFRENTFNFTTVPVTTILSSANLFSPTSVGQLAFLNTPSQAVFAYRNAANALRLGRVGISAGVVGGFTQAALSMPGLVAGAVPFVLENHDGFYAFGESSANPGTFIQGEYDSLGGLVRMDETLIPLPNVADYRGAIILAPEPSGLAMFGTLAGLLLLRRRK